MYNNSTLQKLLVYAIFSSQDLFWFIVIVLSILGIYMEWPLYTIGYACTAVTLDAVTFFPKYYKNNSWKNGSQNLFKIYGLEQQKIKNLMVIKKLMKFDATSS